MYRKKGKVNGDRKNKGTNQEPYKTLLFLHFDRGNCGRSCMAFLENHVGSDGVDMRMDTWSSIYSVLYDSCLYNRWNCHWTLSEKIWRLSGGSGNSHRKSEEGKAL